MGDGRLDKEQRLEREGKDRPRKPKKPTVIGLLQQILAEVKELREIVQSGRG